MLVRADRILDLSRLCDVVAPHYCADNGPPGINPEVALRLRLAGFLLGMAQGRRPLREAQVNLAIRFFIGDALPETLPDHSSFTRIRQLWGAESVRRVFVRLARQGRNAGLILEETVYVDATLIRAGVRMNAPVARHRWRVEGAHGTRQDALWPQPRHTTRPRKLHHADPAYQLRETPRQARDTPWSPARNRSAWLELHANAGDRIGIFNTPQ